MRLMLASDMQRANEHRFAKAHIDGYIRRYLAGEADVQAAIEQGIVLLEEWRNTEFSYDSKNVRMAQIRDLDLRSLITEVFVASAYAQRPELFISFTSKLAGTLKFSDKADSIKTIAEMVAVLSDTGVFLITKAHKYASLMVESNIVLTLELQRFVEGCAYLPPMLVPPEPLTSNRQAMNLTTGPESVILGSHNHHEHDVCLDVINQANEVALCLNLEFLCTVEESTHKPFENQDQQAEWERMRDQSHEMYKLMASQGNKFYLKNKWDKRGRKYVCGYHITTMGSPYKKASIDLHHKEAVTGVPEHLRIKP
jgi:hypothetical protein